MLGVEEGFGVRRATPASTATTAATSESCPALGCLRYPEFLGEGSNAAVDVGLLGNSCDDNRWLGRSSSLPARSGVEQDDRMR